MLPAGYRQRDQTKKSPTGPFDRDALMQHLEKQALEHQDREDLVPFTGEKKGGRAYESVNLVNNFFMNRIHFLLISTTNKVSHVYKITKMNWNLNVLNKQKYNKKTKSITNQNKNEW